MDLISSSEIPIPVSDIVKESTSPFLWSGRYCTPNLISPSLVYFTALDSKLVSTCFSRTSSARITAGRSSPTEVINEMGLDDPSTLNFVNWDTSSINFTTFILPGSSSSFSASILDRSRISEIRVSKTVLLLSIRLTNSSCSVFRTSFFNRSVAPIMVFKGVRNSWLILAKKSDLVEEAFSACKRASSNSF